jgi:hypothetical protein
MYRAKCVHSEQKRTGRPPRCMRTPVSDTTGVRRHVVVGSGLCSPLLAVRDVWSLDGVSQRGHAHYLVDSVSTCVIVPVCACVVGGGDIVPRPSSPLLAAGVTCAALRGFLT